MRRRPPEPPSGKEPATRQERLAEALRANLRRRKAQRRARSEAGDSGDAAQHERCERQ
jgi:hypothetical protein